MQDNARPQIENLKDDEATGKDTGRERRKIQEGPNEV